MVNFEMLSNSDDYNKGTLNVNVGEDKRVFFTVNKIDGTFANFEISKKQCKQLAVLLGLLDLSDEQA